MATRVKDLPVEVRLKLVEDLWDSIAADQNKLPLTEAQKAELDNRLDEFEVDDDLGEPSNVVLDRIRRSL
jgi:putative addiction module component (TIGR02574 family)